LISFFHFRTYFIILNKKNKTKNSLYKNVNGHHVGRFKAKDAYKILSNHSTLELKVGCFKEYFLVLLTEILKYPTEDLKSFFFTSTTSFIRDFLDFDIIFGNIEENKLDESEKVLLTNFLTSSNAHYESQATIEDPNLGQIIPETQENTNTQITINQMAELNSATKTQINNSQLTNESLTILLASLKNDLVVSLDSTINNRISADLEKHLGVNRELTSDQVEKYQIRMGETYNKILKKENSIKILESHIKNNTTPKDLMHKFYPPPHIKEDPIFIERYNQLIDQIQKDTMKLIIVRHTEKIKILQNDFKVFKDVLKYHLNNIEDFSKEVIKNEEKNLLADFEQSNKKCLEAKAEPFKMKNNKDKKAFVKPNMPEKVNKNKTPPNNNKLNTTNNRNNQNKNERQNQKFQRSVSVSPEQRYNNNNNNNNSTGTKVWTNRQPSIFRKNNNDQINQKRSNYVQKASNYNSNSNFNNNSNTNNQNRSYAHNGQTNNNTNGNFRQAQKNPARP
jgi:hypothetical protein